MHLCPLRKFMFMCFWKKHVFHFTLQTNNKPIFLDNRLIFVKCYRFVLSFSTLFSNLLYFKSLGNSCLVWFSEKKREIIGYVRSKICGDLKEKLICCSDPYSQQGQQQQQQQQSGNYILWRKNYSYSFVPSIHVSPFHNSMPPPTRHVPEKMSCNRRLLM